MQLTREQDDAIHLAQTRNHARVMAEIWVEIRENELLHQIEELQIDVHRLNNQINLIPQVGGPQVIFANDDGMEIDANVIAVPVAAEEEEEELEPVEDEDCEGVIDFDTDGDA